MGSLAMNEGTAKPSSQLSLGCVAGRLFLALCSNQTQASVSEGVINFNNLIQYRLVPGVTLGSSH